VLVRFEERDEVLVDDFVFTEEEEDNVEARLVVEDD